MNPAVLTVSGLAKAHRSGKEETLPVIADVGFELCAGETAAILGPNGCGKSTLLRILAGLEAPTRGKIDCAFRRPGPELGYMGQNEQLLPWRTLAGNVRLPLEVLQYEKSGVPGEVERLLDEVGLRSFRNARPQSISGGMRQRALFARLFAGKPRLLLLDEPFSALDLVARQHVATLLRSFVRKHDAAAVVVTHSAEEALAVADKLLLLSARPSRVARMFHFPRTVEERERLGAVPEVVSAMTAVMAEIRL